MITAMRDYAGKDVTFTITVKGISVEKVPELTDDFVKSVSRRVQDGGRV